MDYAFYIIVLLLLGLEWGVAKARNQPLDSHQLMTNILCTVLIVLAEPMTQKLYLSALELSVAHSFQIAMTWPWIIQGLLALLVLDFSVYILHRLQHTVPLLWWIHEPHHQATEMNLSVGFRQSFFSVLIIWLAVVPLLIIGISREVLVATLFIHRLYDALMHTNHPFGFGKLEWILVSPRIHRVHHGIDSKYVNKNFANVFIFIDRVFGTYQAANHEPISIGLAYKNGPILNPIRASIEPLMDLFKIRKVRRLFTFSNH